MGVQKMGSQGAVRVKGGASRGNLEPKSHALTRQGSLYNLTLDEVQHQLGDLGKPLCSMNLDELLKTVWLAETDQANRDGNAGFNPGSASLSIDMCNKTVDEVWRDIQLGRNGDNRDERAHERQGSLGDITLEDFLVKAGIVSESFPMMLAPPQTQWMPYQHNNMMPTYMPGHNQVAEPVYPEPQMSMSPTAYMGALSDTPLGRKRVSSGDVFERTLERRRKRMIKNRESAARSRARKMAYTHELENKVSRLEEENDRLKRMQEVEMLLPSPPLEPKYQLRRTSSAPL